MPEKTQELKSEERKVKRRTKEIFLIGVGGGGIGTINQMMKRLKDPNLQSDEGKLMNYAIENRVLAIDTLEQTTTRKHLDESQIFNLGEGEGAGSPIIGEQWMEKAVPKIREKIKKSIGENTFPACFIVIFSLGGGTGSGGAPYLIGDLQKSFPQTRVLAVMLFPESDQEKGWFTVPWGVSKILELMGKGEEERPYEFIRAGTGIIPIAISNDYIRAETNIENRNQLNYVVGKLLERILYPIIGYYYSLDHKEADEIVKKLDIDNWSKTIDISDMAMHSGIAVPFVGDALPDIPSAKEEKNEKIEEIKKKLEKAAKSPEFEKRGRDVLYRGFMAEPWEKKCQTISGHMAGAEQFSNWTNNGLFVSNIMKRDKDGNNALGMQVKSDRVDFHNIRALDPGNRIVLLLHDAIPVDLYTQVKACRYRLNSFSEREKRNEERGKKIKIEELKKISEMLMKELEDWKSGWAKQVPKSKPSK